MPYSVSLCIAFIGRPVAQTLHLTQAVSASPGVIPVHDRPCQLTQRLAYRLKLSLRVSAYNQKRIEQVQTLYTSSEPLNLKEIAAKTGLTFSTVQYIVYVKLKSKPYTKREYVSFETDDAVHYRIQREFIDTERSLLHNIPDNTCFHQLYLTDGTLYCARNIRSEVIICE